jgi:polyisoprenoid-binding protein YceI
MGRRTRQVETRQTVDPGVLIQMKQELESKKSRVSSMEGRLTAFYEQLEKDFCCKTLKEADAKIKSMDLDLDKKKLDLQKGIEKLQQDFEWDFVVQQ